jgi:hypothetical protein
MPCRTSSSDSRRDVRERRRERVSRWVRREVYRAVDRVVDRVEENANVISGKDGRERRCWMSYIRELFLFSMTSP